MAYHYIRSAQMTPVDKDGGMFDGSYALYHWLANAKMAQVGWSGVGDFPRHCYHECDRQAKPHTRCTDGNMEAVGVASWTTAGGASVAKDITIFKHGTQALECTMPAASTVTSLLLGASVNGNEYVADFWVYNASGETIQAQVNNGLGTWLDLVDCPSTGGWARYYIIYTKNVAGVSYIRLENTSANPVVVYWDSVNIHRNCFEFNYLTYASELIQPMMGQVLAGNTFRDSTLTYPFNVGMVGTFLALWDPVNPENSGVFEITGVAGIDATLNIRVGGAETLTATGASAVWFRHFDIANAPQTAALDAEQSGAGWMMQPEDGEDWIMQVRHIGLAGNDFKGLYLSGSSEECDHDPSSGDFYDTGMSLQRVREDTWAFLGSYVNKHVSRGPGYTTEAAPFLYAMTDDNLSFVTFCMQSSTLGNHAYWRVGRVGEPTGNFSDLTKKEMWAVLARWNITSLGTEIAMADTGPGVHACYGSCIALDGLAMSVRIYAESFWNSKIANLSTNQQENPFDGTVALAPAIVALDAYNNHGKFVPVEIDDMLVGRSGLTTFATIGAAHTHLSLQNGVVWPWNGFSIPGAAAHAGEADVLTEDFELVPIGGTAASVTYMNMVFDTNVARNTWISWQTNLAPDPTGASYPYVVGDWAANSYSWALVTIVP